MSDLFEKLPKKGQVWRHTKTGNEYLVIGSTFNTVTDRVDVLYQPLVLSEFSHYTRQAVGHPKAWLSRNEDGNPRFVLVSEHAETRLSKIGKAGAS